MGPGESSRWAACGQLDRPQPFAGLCYLMEEARSFRDIPAFGFCKNRRAMGMTMNRRDLLFAGGLWLLAGTRASRQGAAAPRAQPQTPSSPPARLLAVLQRNRLPLTISGGPAGRGWDWLVQEARDARFTLIGEEHGVAETAQFSAALFNAL